MPALDAPEGLAVLEDFGDALFARVIEAGEDETPLYLAAIEALVRLHEAGNPPEVLSGRRGDWPLLTYDATALQGGADLFVEWMPKLDAALSFDDAAIAEWRAGLGADHGRGRGGRRSWPTATITPRT
jgi:aminoglycoside/choline kinase family phosphotransferase